MSENFELDVQGLEDDAPSDTNPSLVALAKELVEVRTQPLPGNAKGVLV